MGKEVQVDVIGVVPPCKRCDATWRSAEAAASALRSEGVEVKMNKLDIMSKDVISRYGAIASPALALNGKVRIMGRVPDAKEVETLLREAAK
jgi:glutaredoxin